MTYVAAEARQELLDAIGAAVDEIGVALAALGEAHEQLDEATADRLESELFRPTQLAYGRAQRACAGFAAPKSGFATISGAPDFCGATPWRSLIRSRPLVR